MSLVDEFRQFLGSFKTAEAVSPELSGEIWVSTGLEDPLRKAIELGSDVIVAGSAGGGKTHLMRQVANDSAPLKFVEWPDEGEPRRGKFVRVISDATASKKPLMRQRSKIFSERPRNCQSVIVAINEGILLQLAREEPESKFGLSLTRLHQGQRGIAKLFDGSTPTVIDVGGYDPVENSVVERLLALPLLNEVVESTQCGCESETICPRRLAWKLLKSEQVRQRVNAVVRLVGLRGNPIPFRELWDFIADLAMGGSCDSDPPTSAWFWRVFYGASRVSQDLLQIADPQAVVFPRAEAHIWHGDVMSSEIKLLPGTSLVPVEWESPLLEDRYRWRKCEMFFLMDMPSVFDVIRDQIDLRLSEAIQANKPQEVVGALNSYMTYGTLSPSQMRMDLWTDMGVERRLDHARGQVSLGAVLSTKLELRRSYAVLNHPDSVVEVFGARTFLIHPESGASFLLSGEVLNLLRHGRSFRSSDRPGTDMEWQVSRFYARASSSVRNDEELEVLELDFSLMRGYPRSYQLALQYGTIEQLGELR